MYFHAVNSTLHLYSIRGNKASEYNYRQFPISGPRQPRKVIIHPVIAAYPDFIDSFQFCEARELSSYMNSMKKIQECIFLIAGTLSDQLRLRPLAALKTHDVQRRFQGPVQHHRPGDADDAHPQPQAEKERQRGPHDHGAHDG